jgi:hypothetical protein
MSTLRTAFFVKNVPNWERALRIIVALVVIMAGLAWLAPPWNWIVALSGIGFALTGVFGFCPACAMVGRRLAKDPQ